MGVKYDSNDGTLHLDHNVEMTLTIRRLSHSNGLQVADAPLAAKAARRAGSQRYGDGA